MSETEGLGAWLRAQLDEDERAALAVSEARPGPWLIEQPHPSAYPIVISAPRKAEKGWDYDVLNDVWNGAAAEHVVRWDPARVLAEVAAKRAILELHNRISGYPRDIDRRCQLDKDFHPCRTIRLLAQPYAGREGWQPEWMIT